MIAFVQGVLVERHPTHVVLDVNGLGYEVLIPLSTYDRLPAAGECCRLFTHLHVREDAQILYGFAGAEEKATFEMLILVNGIGPKVAMAVLSGLTVRDLRAAIAEGDVKRLSSVHGVGRKTAERMVVELRDRIDPAEALAARLAPGQTEVGVASLRDAVQALTSLGFAQEQARKMIQHAVDAGADLADTKGLLKRALASR
jgi:Holliday junction DNA helicase RuvA